MGFYSVLGVCVCVRAHTHTHTHTHTHSHTDTTTLRTQPILEFVGILDNHWQPDRIIKPPSTV